MTLKTQMDADRAGVFLNTDEFAETVTYTPSGGQGAEISAQVVREDIEADYDDDGRFRHRFARVVISTGDVASPSERDSVTFDSLTWAVHRVERVEAGMAELVVVRHEPVEKAGPAHRIPRG